MLVTSTSSAADEALYDYTPAFSQLRGVLSRKVFPGPPNYVSIKRGDHPDKCFILTLASPIALRAGKAAQDTFDAVTGVKEVQLVFSQPEQRGQCERLVGKNLRLRGRLIPARQGAEHLPILLIVYSIAEGSS